MVPYDGSLRRFLAAVHREFVTEVCRGVIVVVLVVASLVATAGCGEVARTGRAPVILVVNSIEAAAGGGTDFAAFLLSDVVTGGGVINDSGRATLSTVLKNPGSATAPLGPAPLNSVTITRYRVRFIRADGRDTPGVDVPHAFDGGVTVIVAPNGTAQAVFDLVRHSAKREPPLRNMWGAGAQRFINTIAEVTFYGQDLAGNDISATGTIQVNFGDFADPE
jgi:hypothetical protein